MLNQEVLLELAQRSHKTDPSPAGTPCQTWPEVHSASSPCLLPPCGGHHRGRSTPVTLSGSLISSIVYEDNSFIDNGSSRISRRFHALRQLLPHIATAHRHHEPTSPPQELDDESDSLEPHPRSSSDSMFVLTDRHRSDGGKCRRRKLRRLVHFPRRRRQKEPVNVDGPSSQQLYPSRRRERGRRRQRRPLHSRGERIGRRLRNHDALLHRIVVTPLLVALAVPVALLTCPICAFVVVRNSLMARKETQVYHSKCRARGHKPHPGWVPPSCRGCFLS